MTDDVREALDAMVAAGDDGPPVWAAFHDHSGCQPELHPEPADLVGLEAPPDVWAVGTLNTGRAWHLDDGRGRQECRLGFVMDRAGRTASRMWMGDEVHDIGDERAVGRVPDTMRRVLGLPTDPATVPVGPVLGIEWLCELAEAASELGPLQWSLAAALHPAFGELANGREATAAALARVTDGWTWGDARRRCINGRLHIGCVPPRLAAWMDDGMLCRWILGEHADVRALLREGLAAVVPAARGRVTKVVVGAGPPHRSGRARRPKRA